jgi:inner membrane protein
VTIAFIESLGVWAWFVAGGLLLALEITVPGTFLLWLGLAAFGTGIVALLLEPVWQAQFILFAVLSLVSVILWWRLGRQPAPVRRELNRRAERHIGRVVTLEEPIVENQGRVRIDDTLWRLSGPDAPAGQRVKVTAVHENVLVVEVV